MSQYKETLLFGAAIAVMAASMPNVATAQSVGADKQITMSIPRQGLSDALRQLAEVSGIQLVYDTKITDGKTSPGVSGTMSARAALAVVLGGSRLSFQFSGDRSAIISTAEAATSGPGGEADEVRAVGVVSVEGVGGNMPFGGSVSVVNGVNGSRDVQSTESTGSYTTGAVSITSKVPQTLRETPQSVTVVTSQQIRDQSLVTARDILERITGVTVLSGGNNEEFDIQSRGFNITNFTFDGGAPVSVGFNNRPIIDIAHYDSLQLVRGANGTYAGNGDPGGTVNLVRKKPLDHNQFVFEQDIGSFSNFRSEVDVTGPITSDGKLRARAVASRTDKNYFFDIAEGHKSSIYGIFEYDLFPKTLVTVGASHVRENNIPNQGGLPRYADGSPIDFPRSTCLCSPYAYERPRRTEIFGSVDQQIGGNVTARFNATYSKQRVSALYLNSTSTVIRGVSAIGNFGGYTTDNPLKQLALDFFVNGDFNVLGRRVQIILGGNYQHIDNSGGSTTFVDGSTIPDVLNYDPYSQPAPSIPAVPFRRTLENNFNQYGGYASIKVEVLKNLNISSAWRYTAYSDESVFQYDFDPGPQSSPSLRQRNLSRPNIGVTFDFLKNFTLYGSYQATYQPQQGARFTTGELTPPPVVGVNKEVGLKWQSPNRRLNASLSFYKITQNGFLSTDFNQPNQNIAVLEDIKSEGADFEIGGEIARGWQISVGYSYNKNEITQNDFKRPNSSYTPHHLLKSWTTYRAETGSLRGLILGGGVQLQSSSFQRGFICQDPPSNDPNQGCSGFLPYAFTTKGYATADLKVGYQLSRNVEISLLSRNVTDLKTYSSNPGQNIVGYNSYIEPRSFVGSLNMKW